MRYDPDGGSLAYYATDARASGFLVGAALAWVWRPPAWSRPLPRRARWAIDVAGIAALVAIVMGFVAVSEFDDGLYRHGGFLRVGVLAAVVIVAATRSGGALAAILSRSFPVAVGRRSYGLYLYHWPIFVLGRELPLPLWKINLLCLLGTVAVTEASYRWIETPVRRGGVGALMRMLRVPRPAAVVAFGCVTSAVCGDGDRADRAVRRHAADGTDGPATPSPLAVTARRRTCAGAPEARPAPRRRRRARQRAGAARRRGARAPAGASSPRPATAAGTAARAGRR